MKIIDLLIFIPILIICFCFFRYCVEQTIKKFFKDLKYDTEKIERKLNSLEYSLEYDIAKCREEVRNTKEEFESIQKELNLINEKLVVGKKNEKICQLVDRNKELEEAIERLNKINQEFARDYWERMNNISYYPLVTLRPGDISKEVME